MKNHFGITPKSYALIQEVLLSRAMIEKVVIFGSRASGTARRGSDIDLAIYGKKINPSTAWDLSGYLNERIPIPYHVDVVSPHFLGDQEILESIKREGKVFFERIS